jgi:hypothetical protein
MLGYKTSLNELQRTEVIQSTFSDYSGMQVRKSNLKGIWEVHKSVESKFTLK